MISSNPTARVQILARNTTDHSHYGGMETSLVSFVDAIAATGARLSLVTTKGIDLGGEFARRFDEVHVVEGTREGRYSRAWWLATGREGPWDDWSPSHVVGIGDAGGTYAMRRDRSARVVIQAHGTPFMEAASAASALKPASMARMTLNILRLPSRRRFFLAADAVWAVSERVATSVSRLTRGRVEPSVVSNGISPKLRPDVNARDALRDRLRLAERATVGIYVGRLDAQKGVETCIRAVAERSTFDHLLIVGRGSSGFTRRLQTLAKPISERVTLVGHVEPGEIADYLNASDALLFPTTRREGLPMVLLEAAATGLPIVTTADAGVPADILSSGRVAMVAGGDPAALSSGVRTVTSHPRAAFLPSRYLSSTLSAELANRFRDVASGNSSR